MATTESRVLVTGNTYPVKEQLKQLGSDMRKVDTLRPGEKVRTAWGEEKPVASQYRARPGRGVKGRGIVVTWADDDSQTVYPLNATVDVVA